MKVAYIVLGVFLLMTTVACQSTPMKLPSASIGPNEKSLGQTEGSSTGIMLLGFIPIIQNHRFERAYTSALQRSGSTRLADVIVSERWFWTPAGNGFIFHLQGTGVAPALK